ncbi:MAG: DnaB-like helicase C-terminal domain-containing protein [Myxococcota bacterium]|nr:DnaB-like helicase C-terminal domain-containing protein [Myxococcota bacterium]
MTAAFASSEREAVPGLVGLRRDSERSVLGTCALSPECLDRYDIQDDDFRDDRHRRILRLMRARLREGWVVDTVGLAEHAAGLPPGEQDRLGGIVYLATLGDHWMPVAGLPLRLAELRAGNRRRGFLQELRGSADALLEPAAPTADVASSVMRAAAEAIGGEAGPVQSAKVVVAGVAARMEEQADGKRQRMIRTGIPEWDLDPEFGGLSSEGVTLIVAASGMGKTSVMNRLAIGLASTGVPVYLHGTETSCERRGDDLVLSLGGVGFRDWSRATLRGDGSARALLSQLSPAQEELWAAPLSISGKGLTVDRIVGLARSLHGQGRCGVLLVDYLQDLRPAQVDGLRRGDHGGQVSYSSGELKDLSADLGIPVVVAAQVSNEKAGPASDPKPQLWDVQWSSAAHQDAEELYALYRDDYYRERYGPGWKPRGKAGTIEVIARKRREGRLATLELPFDGPTKWVGARPRRALAARPEWTDPDAQPGYR